jgi:hypothetical protein
MDYMAHRHPAADFQVSVTEGDGGNNISDRFVREKLHTKGRVVIQVASPQSLSLHVFCNNLCHFVQRDLLLLRHLVICRIDRDFRSEVPSPATTANLLTS